MSFVSAAKRFSYYQRIFAAYLTPRTSQLTFWHGTPQVNPNFRPGELGEYYMPFLAKADYAGHYDEQGIPQLDYQGVVGLQYNPIAIAQYGLGNYNLYRRTGDPERRNKFLAVAEWLVDHLERTPQGTAVWYHHFDWEYRDTLKAPWYSALAQGQGLSVLVRAHLETGRPKYLESAEQVLATFRKDVAQGGVTYVDRRGYTWFEEAIVDPPTHILNGFLWASWGIYDYALHTGQPQAWELFVEAVRTLRDNLVAFDFGFPGGGPWGWSLYEQSNTRMKMLASPFYHSLHIVQLRVMYRLTSEPIFAGYADRWEAYQESFLKPKLALAYKALFKLLYY
jgi:heparosan-N-sulfate-glucuronate 5-epimerase